MSGTTRLLRVFLAIAAAVPGAFAGNGSNYLHLINGFDYFFGKTPPAGNLTGIWRCFPSTILHAPTKVVDPNNTPGTYGTYASKIEYVHITIEASPGSTIDFPTIVLSSSLGDCRFMSSGQPNFTLASVAGFGSFIAGPLNTPSGGPVNVLWAAGGIGFQSPASSVAAVQAALFIDPLFTLSAIAVPEDESLVLWFQDDPNQGGVADWQYWVGSFDERTLCSGLSFLWSGGPGLAFAFPPQFEWSIGLGTLDATLTATMKSAGGGPGLTNAHDHSSGFLGATEFDQGSGTRSISITGTSPPNSTSGESLGFAHYDCRAQVPGGFKLIVGNVIGFVPGNPPQPRCHYGPGEVALHPIAGGPVLSTAIPQQPRIPLALDATSFALLANPIWTAATKHRSVVGASNVPWFPAAAAASGSTGNTGGAPLPLPQFALLVGLHMGFCAVHLDPAGVAIAALANSGHSNSNTYDVLFQP